MRAEKAGDGTTLAGLALELPIPVLVVGQRVGRGEGWREGVRGEAGEEADAGKGESPSIGSDECISRPHRRGVG